MDTGDQLHSAAESALIDLCRDIFGRIGAEDSAALIAELSTRVRELADTATDPAPLTAAPSFVADVLADLQRRTQHFEETGSTIMGHSTGLARLDDLLGGLEAGRVTILQAAPGTGKTTLSNQLAYHVAAHSGAPVLYLSFENHPQDLTLKTLCRLAGVSLSQASHGLIQPVKLAEAARLFQARAGTLYYQAGGKATTLESIRATLATIMRAHPNAGHPVVFIDYLQQLARSATLGGREDIFSAISRVSGGLSSLASETGAHVLAISSLNREGYKAGAKPSMASSKGSGDIEFDAAHVLILNTDEKNQPPDSNTDLLHLGLVKNRYGALGGVSLGRDRTTLRIAEIDTRAPDLGSNLVGRVRENGGR